LRTMSHGFRFLRAHCTRDTDRRAAAHGQRRRSRLRNRYSSDPRALSSHPGGGWCYALASSHALVVGAHFEEDVQRELFGSEGDFRAAFAAGPAGIPTFERRDGGYQVSGLWAFASGIPVSTHFLGGAFMPDVDGALAPVTAATGCSATSAMCRCTESISNRRVT